MTLEAAGSDRAAMADLDRRELLRAAGAGAVALTASAAGVDPDRTLAAVPTAPASRIGGRALRELRGAVHGPVLTPGDPGYATARLLYNERFDRIRPAAVVQVRGVGDVKAVIRWANRHDVRVSARSGGHSYGGYSTNRNGVVIDLRRLRGIDASNGGRRATVAAGVPLSGMYARLARRGMTVPGGTCPTVGIAGLTLGGGVGFASRKLGLTCDNLTGLGIVTADGRFHQIDARHHPDLFWACRGGGGGNFGIVTAFTFRTHRVTSAAYFHASWPWEQADSALDAWQRFAPGAPDALSSVFSLRTGRKGPKLGANGQFFGSERRLRRLLEPLAAVDGVKLEVGTEGYKELMLRWAGCSGATPRACRTGAGRTAFYAKSDYAAAPLDSAGRARMLAAIEAGQPLEQNGGSAEIILDAYGGAINRIDPGATAFVHRDQLYDIQYITRFGDGGRGAASAWVQRAHRMMLDHVSGEAYQNYIDPRLRGWKRAYYGSNYERLVDVKTRYDPDDRLRFRQGIRPRG